MTSSRERHIRQIVDRANEDKSSQLKVRRSVPSGCVPVGGKSGGVKGRTAGGVERESVKPVTREGAAGGRGSAGRSVAGAGVTNRTAGGGGVRESVKPIGKVKESVSKKEQRSLALGQNARIWIGFVLVFIAGVLILSCLSYFKYWKQDADLAQWGSLLERSVEGAKNWCGKLGAILGELFVGRWFGIFGVLSGFWVLCLAVKVFGIRGLKLKRSLRATLVVMFVGSVVLGHFPGKNLEIFGSGYGGAMGIGVAQWLEAVIGVEGTSLLLAVLGIGTIYYVNSGWCVRVYKRVRSVLDRYSQYKSLKAESQRLRNAALAAQNEAKREEIARAAKEKREKEMEALRAVAGAGGLGAVVDQSAMPSEGAEVKNENNKISGEQEAVPVAVEGEGENPFKEDVNPDAFALAENEVISGVGQDAEEKIATLADVFKKPHEVVAARVFDHTIELDNGQMAAVSSFYDDGSYDFLYLDSAALAEVVQPSVGAELFVDRDSVKAAEDDFDEMFSRVEKEEALDDPTVKQERLSEDELPQEQHRESAPAEMNDTNRAAADFKKPVKVIEGEEGEPDLVVEYTQGEESVDDSTINQMELYDPTLELRNYKKPPINLLTDHKNEVVVTDEELKENQERILYTLGTFGIKIDKIEAVVGPTVTLYEIIPAPGVRISKIKNLEDDIALSLAALGIRIIAPIPGKGTIGIEVPNKDKEIVSMYSVIKSAKFQDSKADLPVAIGKTIQNETFVFDLAKMPHLLVAGATGQGKSVGLNAIITSLLYKKHPSELKFILVDPKKVELTLYSKLENHFLAKIPDAAEAIITDTQKVIFTLNSICIEMDARYDLLKEASVRSIKEYNDKFIRRKLNPNKGHRFLPYFVVIIDEFADLIMTAGREVETPIARIAQLARAVGIHLIIATQRPTTNIITGVIKANFPARIAFRVTSQIDSRTILDHTGANQLIGRGDMLISTGSDITRVQCAFVDTPEVDDITAHIGRQQGYCGAYELPEYVPDGGESSAKKIDDGKRDPLFADVARYVVDNQSGSASTIQRKFSIGFNRAGRLVDQLEAAGIVGRQEGSKPRQVLLQDVVTLERIIDNN